jgi:DNA-binding response OmpR family regulator
MDSQTDKKAIVIVEDNEQIAELIKDTLNAEPDYQAVAVHDGALALEVIRSVKASLILLDVNLPGMDGLELFDMLQENGDTCSIPVIFVTANTDTAEFKRRNVTNYIAKPFDLNDLVSRVDAVCRADGREQ